MALLFLIYTLYAYQKKKEKNVEVPQGGNG